jgi:plasmid stabilization system protein ParE
VFWTKGASARHDETAWDIALEHGEQAAITYLDGIDHSIELIQENPRIGKTKVPHLPDRSPRGGLFSLDDRLGRPLGFGPSFFDRLFFDEDDEDRRPGTFSLKVLVGPEAVLKKSAVDGLERGPQTFKFSV